MAKIYKTSAGRSGEWQPFTKAGALLFLRDSRQDNNMFLRLVDIDTDQSGVDVMWEHELWLRFLYRKAAEFFYTFESDVPLSTGSLFLTYRTACTGSCLRT